MGTAYGKFKYNIGDKIDTFERNLVIIDRKYVDNVRFKDGKRYNEHRKYYKYKCLNCNNEDWVIEYTLNDSQHCGCNACCYPPKKLVQGINDIATTNPWMIKYFDNPDDANKYFKFSKEKKNMRCPDCGRIHKNIRIYDVYRNKGLSCPCGDGWSYPNKFMYSLLEQLGVDFEAEKIFDWSDNRKYDDYIKYNGLKIITEQHGLQHYEGCINPNSRTLEEEKENDEYKRQLAIKNGIDKYFVINSSISSLEHMKNSILKSGLLSLFNKSVGDINWELCDEFATSNLAKRICDFKENNSNITIKEISKLFHISYNTALDYIKKGSKFGWCSYQMFDDLKMLREQNKTVSCEIPIHCISTNKYYRSANLFASEYEKEYGKHLQARNIRSVCQGKRNHVNNLKFEYITQEEFNNIKLETPELVVGDFFKLKKIA